MSRRKLLAVILGTAVAIAAVVVLRSEAQPPPPPAVGPDGETISAFHDPGLVTRPQRPSAAPQRPGPLHTDPRRGGTLVSWAPVAGHGFEVRWGPPGRPDNVRYVATPSVGLRDLAPGRYRVEVRSVDEVGQRSEPSSVEVDVADGAPQWQQGLGFVDDFEQSEGLDAVRWRVSDNQRHCLRREPGALLLTGCGFTELRPTSPLVLGEADADGVRGRVVLVTDAPGEPPPRPPGMPEDAEFAAPEGLVITLAPREPRLSTASPLPPEQRQPGSVRHNAQLPAGSVQVRLTSRGVFFTVGDVPPVSAPVEHSLTPSEIVSPGAPHRWEVRVKDDRVEVHRDGLPVTSAAVRPTWREASVTVSTFVPLGGQPTSAPPLRIGFVGVTGPAPEHPVRVLDLMDSTGPGSMHTLQVPPLPQAGTARLVGELVPIAFTDQGQPRPPAVPSEVTADIDGQRMALRQPGGGDFGSGGNAPFAADVPVSALADSSSLTLSSAAGDSFVVFNLQLEVDYPAGTDVDVGQPALREPVPPEPAAVELVVRQGDRVVNSGERVGRVTLEVEARPDSLAVQAMSGSLLGWVAMRVELDGRRILDHPTAAAGPAFAGGYRFTLTTTDLPADDARTLTVTFIADRSGPRPAKTSFTLRVKD